jgi:hypothetical protein
VDRFAIFATAVWDRPAATATTRRGTPAATAALMRLSRRAVHSRALSAALVTGERSVIGLDGFAARKAGVDVDEASEALLGHAELDGPVAVLALVVPGLCHVPTVNQVSNSVNKVAA